MDSLIGAVNELQDAFAEFDAKFALDLPQIAVVGCQSAGKSSVLENIVGKDFLPRGAGIVTRRPLILQLVRNSSNEEYGEFLHLNRKDKFYDFRRIRDEIQRETDRVCGENKGVSSAPINLRVYSPNVLDLTLIDLPGMTKVAVGDQPPDIEIQIRQLILQFVENPNCLILAVSPANADLANSDALQLAHEVDPQGIRTIGVLTKVDLMDDGTDARNILKNEVIPLKYGFIGVVNRSQQDIEREKHIQAALEAEKMFFLGQPAYRDIADQQGTAYLQKALNFHLIRHIAEILPDLKSKLQKRLTEVERQLGDMAVHEVDYEDPFWKTKALLTTLLTFAETFRNQMMGYTDVGLSFDHLSSGAKIEYLFQKRYPALLKAVDFTDEALMKKQIGFAILNNIGPRVAVFTPDKAFDQIVRVQIKKLQEPTMDMLDAVAAELLKSLDVALQVSENFPRLAKEIESRVNIFIMQQLERTREEMDEFIKCENAYINAGHEDFVGFSYAEYVATRRVLVRRNPATETVKSGYLKGANLSKLRDKRYWFVLTPETLSWYTDESRKQLKYVVAFDDFFMISDDTQRVNKLVLYNTKNKNVYKELTRLELVTANAEDSDAWKRSFARVGIFADSQSPANSEFGSLLESSVSKEILDTNDPNLERQIETIWVLVDSYMQIVLTTLRRMMPKIVAHSLIANTVGFLSKKFIADFSRTVNVDEVMEENEGEREKRWKAKRVCDACRNALDKLNRVTLPRSEFKVYETKKLVKAKAAEAETVPQRPARAAKPSKQQSVAVEEPTVPVVTTTVVVPRKKSSVGGIFRRNSLSTSSNKNLSSQMEKARQQVESSEKSMFYVM